MRAPIVVALAITCGFATVVHADQGAVDLGAPGALEALQLGNPGHYRKAMDVIRTAEEVSCETLPGILKVRYEDVVARCSAVQVLTSYPAKRHLWFKVDGTDYFTRITLRLQRAELIPAR